MTKLEALRMTRQRRVLLEALRGMRTHPTAEQLFLRVRTALPRISLGTVYRNLELLSAQGMIRKLDLGAARRRFDGDVARHYHIRCIKCGKIDDLAIEPVLEIEQAANQITNYEVTGHTLEVTGICPDCKRAIVSAEAYP